MKQETVTIYPPKETSRNPGPFVYYVHDAGAGNVRLSRSEDGRFGPVMPRESVKHFVNDLSGKVAVPLRGHREIDAIAKGRAKLLGKGDDGLAFLVGSKVVKVSTTVPYQPENQGHLSPGDAIERLRRQTVMHNRLAAVAPNVVDRAEFVKHGDKGFQIKPFVEMPSKFTREQLDRLQDGLIAIHRAGYCIRDEIQAGIRNGKAIMFDVALPPKPYPPNNSPGCPENRFRWAIASWNADIDVAFSASSRRLSSLWSATRGPMSARGFDTAPKAPRDPSQAGAAVTAEDVSTALQERQNGTMRHKIGRTRRLCYGFSKRFDHHVAAVALGYVWYSLGWIAKGLRMTPAMAAGVTDRLWTIEEFHDAITEAAREPEAKPEKKPLAHRTPEGTARELPNGREFLRVVQGGGEGSAGVPMSPPPASPVEPSGQLDLLAWVPRAAAVREVSRAWTQLDLFD